MPTTVFQKPPSIHFIEKVQTDWRTQRTWHGSGRKDVMISENAWGQAAVKILWVELDAKRRQCDAIRPMLPFQGMSSVVDEGYEMANAE